MSVHPGESVPQSFREKCIMGGFRDWANPNQPRKSTFITRTHAIANPIPEPREAGIGMWAFLSVLKNKYKIILSNPVGCKIMQSLQGNRKMEKKKLSEALQASFI